MCVLKMETQAIVMVHILMKDMYMFTKNDVYEYDSFIDLKKFRGVHVV